MEDVDGPVDLWRSFALPIPSLTICELLGVPYDERASFQRLSAARFDLAGGANVSLAAVGQSLSYLRDLVVLRFETLTDQTLEFAPSPSPRRKPGPQDAKMKAPIAPRDPASAGMTVSD